MERTSKKEYLGKVPSSYDEPQTGQWVTDCVIKSKTQPKPGAILIQSQWDRTLGVIKTVERTMSTR